MENSLLALRPDLAAQWADPERAADSVSIGTAYRALWTCSHGHVWRSRVADRVKGSGCPVCSGRVAESGVNDFATLYPDLARDWADTADACSFLPGSHYNAAWMCPSGHTWNATIKNRVARASGCPVCAGQQAGAGTVTLAEVNPTLAKEWADARPINTVLPNSGYKANWVCERGHNWKATVQARNKGQGCPVCANRTILVGYNDLATTHPRLASEMVEPLPVVAGSGRRVTWRCSKGHLWDSRVADRTDGHGCPECASTQYVSRFEKEVADCVRSLGIVPETSVRRLPGVAELDIFIPYLGIAIECQGIYWHSERFKAKGVHAAKRAACEALGIRLIQIWEDDWAERRQVVERMLAHKLGVSTEPRIGARSTTARSATTAEAREFLNANHIQGFTGATHYLALEHEGRLAALMSLKRTGKPGELRLERYATAAHVLGGQSKLIRFAERVVPGWSHLITFADHEVSDGGLYERTGWVRDGELAPDYKYVVQGRRVHKFNYRLARFRDDPALEYEEGFSERRLAELNGISRVWDSGKTRYRYDRT